MLCFVVSNLRAEARFFVFYIVGPTRLLWLGSVVVGRWTCDREVASSTPGRCIAG